MLFSQVEMWNDGHDSNRVPGKGLLLPEYSARHGVCCQGSSLIQNGKMVKPLLNHISENLALLPVQLGKDICYIQLLNGFHIPSSAE